MSEHSPRVELVDISVMEAEINGETFVADLGSSAVAHDREPYETGHLREVPLEDRPKGIDVRSRETKGRR